MSLVHNALKKAELERQLVAHSSRETAVDPDRARPETATKKKRRRLSQLAVEVLIVMCLVGILAVFLVKFGQSQRLYPKQPVGRETPVEGVSASTPIDEAKVEPMGSQDATAVSPVPVKVYKLTGIMKDAEGRYMAILNNRVIGVGGYVEGATVRDIVEDRVAIDVDGREQILRLDGTTP
jgi:hypothetical protein